MSKKIKFKQVKYRDLPLDLRNQVDFTYGHIQKTQNSTVKHIIEKLKKHEKIYIEKGVPVTAQENREAIDKLEGYMNTIDQLKGYMEESA